MYIDSGFTYFAVAKHIKKITDNEIYGIAAVNENAAKYLENQDYVQFNKLWIYPDHLDNKNKKPDLDYLKSIERKYNINIWRIAYGDRRFWPEYNIFYKFSRNEILLIMEQACKFFDSIIEETKPDFLLLKSSFAHDDNLLYEMCKNCGIQPFTLFPSRLGYRYRISSKVDHFEDSFETPELENKFNTFDDLQNYHSNFSMFKVVEEMQTSYKYNKKDKLKAFLKFLFLENTFQNHYVNYGKTKWNVMTKGTARQYYWKKRKNENFMKKHFLHKINPVKPFIFYPLHMDPERALLVNRPFFTEQIEILRKIVKSIPIDFEVYVKDHPAMNILGWRPESYYKEISSIPGVKLLYPLIKPEEIYKKCSLVITINSTSALEANFYGKPSVIFNNLDFSQISSIHTISKFDELPDVIDKALHSMVDSSEVGRYLTKLAYHSFEFDHEGITRDFLSTFSYPGFLDTPNYPDEKMRKYFKKHENAFKNLTLEHLKYIKHYQENSLM